MCGCVLFCFPISALDIVHFFCWFICLLPSYVIKCRWCASLNCFAALGLLWMVRLWQDENVLLHRAHGKEFLHTLCHWTLQIIWTDSYLLVCIASSCSGCLHLSWNVTRGEKNHSSVNTKYLSTLGLVLYKVFVLREPWNKILSSFCFPVKVAP